MNANRQIGGERQQNRRTVRLGDAALQIKAARAAISGKRQRAGKVQRLGGEMGAGQVQTPIVMCGALGDKADAGAEERGIIRQKEGREIAREVGGKSGLTCDRLGHHPPSQTRYAVGGQGKISDKARERPFTLDGQLGLGAAGDAKGVDHKPIGPFGRAKVDCEGLAGVGVARGQGNTA